MDPDTKLFKYVFAGEGVGLTIENIRSKGSSCVEALEEVNRKMSHFFGRPDRHRKHKESKFTKDLQALVEHMQNHKLHTLTPDREVRSPLNQKNTWKKGAVVDVMQVGAEALMGGKYSEFLQQTTYDPAVGGYPLGDSDEHEQGVDSTGVESVFDHAKNPLSYEDEESVKHAMDTRSRKVGIGMGIGGVGGADDLYMGAR